MRYMLCMYKRKMLKTDAGTIGRSMALAAANLVVRGRVQGVGFRFFVRQHARDLGLTGWVKNLPDRNVEIYAEGEKETLDTFISDMREGPTFSHVSDIDIDWLEPSGRFSGFDIRF